MFSLLLLNIEPVAGAREKYHCGLFFFPFWQPPDHEWLMAIIENVLLKPGRIKMGTKRSIGGFLLGWSAGAASLVVLPCPSSPPYLCLRCCGRWPIEPALFHREYSRSNNVMRPTEPRANAGKFSTCHRNGGGPTAADHALSPTRKFRPTKPTRQWAS